MTPGIPQPERRQALELRAEVERQLGAAHDGVHAHDRREILLGEILRRACGEGLGKGLDVLRADGETGGRPVSAPAAEQARAGAECAVQVESRDRAPGARPLLVAARNEHDRAVEALDEPRRDDPDHPAVPVFACEHVAAAALLRFRPLGNLGKSLAQDPVLDRLAVAVERLELAREPVGFLRVVRQEELERGARMPEPSCGVDPRRKAEADRARIDGRGIDPRGAHECSQPGVRRDCEPLQARGDQTSVLVEKRDDVRDRGERDEVEPAVEVGRAECLRELVDDTGSAELGERVVGRTRRDHGAVGKRLARPVVVGDDDVEPQLLGVRDLFDRRDPAIDREDQPGFLAGEAGQAFRRTSRSPLRSGSADARRPLRRARAAP